MENANLRAGFARCDITPPAGMQLAGFPDVLRRCTGVHDAIYATAAVLYDGFQYAVIVSLDLLWYEKSQVAKIRKMAKELTGIDERSMLLCCTHTHSAHMAASFGDFTPEQLKYMPDENFINTQNQKIAMIIKEAFENLQCVTAGTAVSFCDIRGNRRDPVNGANDNTLTTVAFKDENGEILGIINNYTLHPTALHEDNTLVSADYVGYLRSSLEEKYKNAAILFLQGALGDQSNRHFKEKEGFEESLRIGNALAEKAIFNLEAMDFSPDFLTIGTESIDLPLRELPDERTAEFELETARKELKNPSLSGTALRNAQVRMFGAACLLSYTKRMQSEKERKKLLCELPAELIALSIGNLVIIGTQGELFCEFGLEIKRLSPFQYTIVSCLTNGGLPGYVCTEEAFTEGGYEVGSSLMSPKAGKLIVEEAVTMIGKVYSIAQNSRNI